jgi:hypothetical protein
MGNVTRYAAATAVLLLCGPVQRSEAALYAVDPGPYTEATGFFPRWYQDTNGRALELCLSPAVIAADPTRGLVGGPACTLLANPGIFDPDQPIAFPDNFPDESFWFMADAAIDSGGVSLTYGAAIEAAFGGGVPAPDDQISFARIRIRVTLPASAPNGTYTVTHPYGVEVFEIAAGGVRAINMTRDIGIGGLGDFTGALRGDIGPFLVDNSVPSLGLIPDETGTEFFIGDPNTPMPVVGSPFGTNFVRIEGPQGSNFPVLETNLFTIMGKVFGGALPTPALVERSTYSRVADAGGAVVAQQDVFVKAPPTSSLVEFDAVNEPLPTAMADGDADGAWFGQSPVNPSLPGTVTVRAANPAGNNTQTTVPSPLVDLVIITRAEYATDPSTGALTLFVEAASSDEVSIPALTANGRPMTSVGGGTLQTVSITGLAIPPARVTVTSARGGSDTEEVIILP